MALRNDNGVIRYVDIMQAAALDAIRIVEDMDRNSFAESKVTFAAVAFYHFLAGQAASDLLEKYPEFATDHPQLPWNAMRDGRDRIAQNYFDIHAVDIWDATQDMMRKLVIDLDELRSWRAQGE